MKIAMLIEARKPLWWWWQAVALELSRHLCLSYADVHIDLYTMHLQGYEWEKIEQISSSFTIYHTGKPTKRSFLARIKWCRLVINIIQKKHKKEPYDIIYAHANLPWIPWKILSRRLSLPVIYHVHGSWIEAMKKMYGTWLKSNILFAIENYIQTKILYDLEISVDKKFLTRKNCNKAIFIPNGIDLQKFSVKEKITNKIKDKTTKKEWMQFLFVWRLHPQKWLIYLIQAINMMQKILRHNGSHFTLVGEWEQYNILKEMIEEYNISDLAVLYGKCYGDDLVDLYHKSDVFILPSLFEWMPLVLLEARACWLPVIATNVGEIPNLIDEEKTWWIVKPEDYIQLANTLAKISAMKKDEISMMGMAGRNIAEQKYSWQSIAGKIYSILRKISV